MEPRDHLRLRIVAGADIAVEHDPTSSQTAVITADASYDLAGKRFESIPCRLVPPRTAGAAGVLSEPWKLNIIEGLD